MIPYGRQTITQEDIDTVCSVLKSDFLTQGAAVPLFEKTVSDFCGVNYAVAVNSATSALHIACRALGLGAGDELWTTPISFVASANCGLYCGARIDFVDIDSASLNMSADALERRLIEAAREGRKPKIVIPVHLCGQPCDMRRIRELSQEFGFKVIEDASHAIGATYLDTVIGDCCYSDITVFSFHPVKIITTGEGGMALTRDGSLARKMELLRSHGITRDPLLMTEPSHGGWYYQQLDLGFNYRLTDIQAALGVSQMGRLHAMLERRRQLAERYDNLLSSLPLVLPQRTNDRKSAWHLYIARLAGGRTQRAGVFRYLRDVGIGVNVHYIPIHLQPYFRALGFERGDFPNSEAYYEQAVTLPIFPAMTDEQQNLIVAELSKAMNRL